MPVVVPVLDELFYPVVPFNVELVPFNVELVPVKFPARVPLPRVVLLNPAPDVPDEPDELDEFPLLPDEPEFP